MLAHWVGCASGSRLRIGDQGVPGVGTADDATESAKVFRGVIVSVIELFRGTVDFAGSEPRKASGPPDMTCHAVRAR